VFVLQVRRPNYWRIELPNSKDKSGQKGEALREVLDKILQFEKTWCPFQRAFFIDLPDEPSGTLKKKPWTPVSPESMDQGPSQDQWEAGRDIHHPFQAGTTFPTNLAEVGNPAKKAPAGNETDDFSRQRLVEDDAPRPPMDLYPGAPGHLPSDVGGSSGTGSSPTFLAHFMVDKPATVADIVSDIDSRDSGATDTADMTTINSDAVSDAVSSPNPLSTLRTSDTYPILTSEMNKAYDDERSPTLMSAVTRRRQISAANMTKAIDHYPLPANGALSVKHSSHAGSESSNWVHEASQSLPPFAPRSSSASIKGEQTEHITDLGGLGMPRVPGAWVSTADLGVTSNEMSLAETIEISAPSGSSLAIAGLGHENTRPASLQFNSNPSRANPLRVQYRSPFAAASKIPLVILTKTCEILLGPPSHLVELILKIAARITAGEWRGQADGVDENGQRIPIHWDYSDDELSGCDEDSYNMANQSNDVSH
jgi:hypothetical protein